MAIRAVVFDIGGVLEITPSTAWDARCEARLSLQPGELDQRLGDVWRALHSDYFYDLVQDRELTVYELWMLPANQSLHTTVPTSPFLRVVVIGIHL